MVLAAACLDMPRHALKINLSETERQELERWRRAGRTEKRMLPRMQIVELAAQGLSSRQIAARLGLRRPSVLKWRRRFCERRLDGLRDAPRSGPRRRDTAATERRILAQTAGLSFLPKPGAHRAPLQDGRPYDSSFSPSACWRAAQAALRRCSSSQAGPRPCWKSQYSACVR